MLLNHIDGVMQYHARLKCDRSLVQTKDYKIGICCFSAKHAALKGRSNDWFVQNRVNVSEWSDMFTCGLLSEWSDMFTCGLLFK